MGIYDRDYYREPDEEPGYSPEPNYRPGPSVGPRVPLLSSMVNRLVLINAVLYLIDQASPGGTWLMREMAVTPETLAQPLLWWKFLTAGFAHSPLDFRHILFNMFGLWMFGRDVERVLGRWEFLRFYLVALVLGNVAWAAREYLFVGPSNITLLGASGAVTAVIMLFALKFPRRTVLLFFVIPMPAWGLGVLIVLLNLFGGKSSGGGPQVAYDVHLVGAAFGFLYHQLGLNLGRLMTGGISLRSLMPKRRIRVHDPDNDDRGRDIDDRADRILEKLHREGEGSLTAKERRLLEAYSRRMQQKQR